MDYLAYLYAKGITLKSFFDLNCIKQIAIYGYGAIGRTFEAEAQKCGVEIKYIFDAQQKDGKQTHRPEDLGLITDVDLIIVCMKFSGARAEEISIYLKSLKVPCIAYSEIVSLVHLLEITLPTLTGQLVHSSIMLIPPSSLLRTENPTEIAISSIIRSANYMASNPPYFSEVYKGLEEYGDSFIRQVFQASPTIAYKNTIIHSNIRSDFVNVVNGIRFTAGTPEMSVNTIHLIGQCVAFGYGVDDSNTVASHLQGLLNESGLPYRVENNAAWGLDVNFGLGMIDKLDSIYLHPGDHILFLIYSDFSLLTGIESFYAAALAKASIVYNFSFTYLLKRFNEPRNGRLLYIDYAHLSPFGMKRAAEAAFQMLKSSLPKSEPVALESVSGQTVKPHRSSTEHGPETAKNLPGATGGPVASYGPEEAWHELPQYLDFLELNKTTASTAGAIVMNCNPFTHGHKYLIDIASSQVERLYIFVVEEDQSVFPFQDRLELVKKGTADFDNVTVLPSGKYIISAITFPEYFTKDGDNGVNIDATLDVELFAEYIAPVLNIQKRFIGQEPFDAITRQYNETLKTLLPAYGIKVQEIARLSCSGEVISASKVRKLLAEKKWPEIMELVPDSTYEYLKCGPGGAHFFRRLRPQISLTISKPSSSRP